MYIQLGLCVGKKKGVILLLKVTFRGEGVNRLCYTMTLNLHLNDDQKPKLLSLSRGNIISYEGTITILPQIIYSTIDMNNVNIID
jgi:hypothetical protein